MHYELNYAAAVSDVLAEISLKVHPNEFNALLNYNFIKICSVTLPKGILGEASKISADVF